MPATTGQVRDAAPGPLARRPAAAAALCFVLGIVAHPALPRRPLVCIALLAALLTLSLLAFRRPLVGSALLALALGVAGLSVAQLYGYYYPHGHVSAFATDQPRLAEMELVVVDPPRVLTAPFAPHRPLPPKQVTKATVARVKTWDGWAACNGEILVQVLEPHPRLAAGQRVRVLGMLERPGPAMNPGQFDWTK